MSPYPAAADVRYSSAVIANPGSEFIAGPLHKAEGILYAELDPQQSRRSKWMFDPAGHYARPDVFQLTIRRTSNPMLAAEERPL